MKFNITEATAILERTPSVLDALLQGLPDHWTTERLEGPDTWSPYDVVGHLIHGEKTDWIPRMEVILGDGDKHFVPFDRFAQYNTSQGKTLTQLLEEFRALREANLARLRSFDALENRLQETGIHPDFGEVTVLQLLSTWAVHDLNHIYQVTRVLAKHYKEDVGPWTRYLRILSE